MFKILKRVLKNIIPPYLVGLFKNLFEENLFVYGFDNWGSALNNSSSYDTEEVFNKTVESARKVRDGLAVYERDSVIFDEIQYDWQFLSCLLLIANISKRLNVVDFGGALGTSYRQNKFFLEKLDIELKWTIIEQEKFVKMGQQEFTTSDLKFVYRLKDIEDHDIDVVVLSCSLCYLEKPYEVLNEIISCKPRFILISRNPMIESTHDIVALQTVRPSIYKASYPVWNFDFTKFKNFFLDDYDCLLQWEDEIQDFGKALSVGFLFSLKN